MGIAKNVDFSHSLEILPELHILLNNLESLRMLLLSNSFKNSAGVSSRPDASPSFVNWIALIVLSLVIGDPVMHSLMGVSFHSYLKRSCENCFPISIVLCWSVIQFLFSSTKLADEHCLYIPIVFITLLCRLRLSFFFSSCSISSRLVFSHVSFACLIIFPISVSFGFSFLLLTTTVEM